MPDDKAEKIVVSYDELNTRKVEARLKEQDALTRNRVYAAMDEKAVGTADPAAAGRLVGLWRNTIFALALFGLIGGLLAWGCGTLLEFKGDLAANTTERIVGMKRLMEIADEGKLSYDDTRRALDGAISDGRENNPHFAVAFIRTDAEFRRKSLDRITVLRQTKVMPEEEARRREEQELAIGRLENPDFAVMTDGSLGDAAKQKKLADMATQREQEGHQILARESTRALIGNVLAYGVRGVILGVLLAIAVPLTENNIPATIVNGSVGAALGLLGGVAAAYVTSRIQSTVANEAPDSAKQFLATVATWGVLGIFLTLAPGIVMRNPKKLIIGLMGGLIGGLIGGVLIEPIKNWRPESPRLAELVAMIAIGLLAGLATGLIEDAAKSGWLKVVQGLIAGKQFILYRNPTFIGGGPDCQIYLFKDPKVGKRHAAIHIVAGGFEIEDLPLGSETFVNGKSTQRQRLKNGDRIQIGSTQLVFMEKKSS